MRHVPIQQVFGILLAAMLAATVPPSAFATTAVAISGTAAAGRNYGVAVNAIGKDAANREAVEDCRKRSGKNDCEVILTKDQLGYGALYADCPTATTCGVSAMSGFRTRDEAHERTSNDCKSYYKAKSCMPLAQWQETGGQAKFASAASPAQSDRGEAKPAGNNNTSNSSSNALVAAGVSAQVAGAISEDKIASAVVEENRVANETSKQAASSNANYLFGGYLGSAEVAPPPRKEFAVHTGPGGLRLTISVPAEINGPYDFAKNPGGYAMSDEALRGVEVMFNEQVGKSGVLVLQVRMIRRMTVKNGDQPVTAESLADNLMKRNGFHRDHATKIAGPKISNPGAIAVSYLMSGFSKFDDVERKKEKVVSIVTAVALSDGMQGYSMMATIAEKDIAAFDADPKRLEFGAKKAFRDIFQNSTAASN